jgi:hypothetical protein
MKKNIPRARFIFLFSMVFFTTYSFGVESLGLTIAIDQDRQTIDSAVDKGELPFQHFAKDSNTETWKTHKSKKEMDAYCENRCFEFADVYFRGQSPVFANGVFTSPSQDWINYVHYYFRANGSVEKISSDLRRFGAMEKNQENQEGFLVEVLRDKYFSPDGKCILVTNPKFINLSAKKIIEGEVEFLDGEWPIYTQIQETPFYHLIDYSQAQLAQTCTGPRKLIFHLGFSDEEPGTVKKRMRDSIDQIKLFALKNKIQLVEDPQDNDAAYSLVCGVTSSDLKSIETGQDLINDCRDFFGFK